MLSNVMKPPCGKDAKASRLNAKQNPGATCTLPKDPHFLPMKNKAERTRFLFWCVALELSLGRFLDASVKDFSDFLGSVGAFGHHFWGHFGVIFGSWGALGRQRAPRSNSSGETDPMAQHSGHPFGDQNP